MDQIELDLARREAGSEYLSALRTLGLRPDALFWSFDKVEGRFVLMLVTEMVDFKGPLAVADLLFQAYNASATPKEIDPFVVRLHSPEHDIIRRFDGWKDPSKVTITPPPGGLPIDPSVMVTGIEIGGLMFQAAWVYHFALPPKRKSVDLSRRWSRFAHNVERLAA